MAARRTGERIVITVADEGPGIPPSDLTRVFERFYRVDKSRTREGKDPGGTGLGLSIVRHLVELHGGRVSAANRPERGAIFTVELPASARQRVCTEAPAAPAGAARHDTPAIRAGSRHAAGFVLQPFAIATHGLDVR